MKYRTVMVKQANAVHWKRSETLMKYRTVMVKQANAVRLAPNVS